MSGIRAYDMRKIVSSLANEEEFSVAYLRDFLGNGKYIPVYISPEMYGTPLSMPDIEEASEKGLLFAYADMKILNEFLPSIADMPEGDYDIDTALKFCSEYSIFNSATKT